MNKKPLNTRTKTKSFFSAQFLFLFSIILVFVGVGVWSVYATSVGPTQYQSEGTSCPAGTKSVFVDSYSVSGTDPVGASVPLETGTTYLFHASGMFKPTAGASWFADAGYTTEDGWVSSSTQYGIVGISPDFGAHALLGDFGSGDVGIIQWGSYNPSHEYDFVKTAIGTSGQFVIGDRYGSWYSTEWDNQVGMSDNSGSLSLNVYKCRPIPVYELSASCPSGTEAVLVDSRDISATDPDGETVSFDTSFSYLFTASGTFKPTAGASWFADAGYTTEDGWITESGQYGIAGIPPDFGAHALLADLGGGVGVVQWGPYDSSHQYSGVYTPTTTSGQFVIGDRYDSWYSTEWNNQVGMSDNSGSLSLNVYKCRPIPVYELSASCPVGTHPVEVGTYDIFGNDPDGEMISLDTSFSYLFSASGTFSPATGASWFADAGYTTDDDWAHLRNQYGIGGTPPDLGAHALLADLGLGVGIVNWGPYDLSHQYSGVYQPTTTNGQFVIGDRYDGWFDTIHQYQKGMIDNSESLSLTVSQCQENPKITVLASKVVCDNEADLPNWGLGDNTPIDANTAAAYVAEHQGCHLADGWDFQWNLDGWHNFDTLTTTSTMASAVIDISSLAPNGQVGFREVTQPGYIPFVGGYDNNVTAEFYCYNDVKQYDNIDYVRSPEAGGTYYCVGFNAPIPHSITVLASKVVCDNEADLPNWGLGDNTPIDANTAAAYVAEHQGCHLADGWDFQWNLDGWHNFDTLTTTSTMASAVIDISSLAPNGQVGFREVTQPGYIPFVGGYDNNVTAEFYCYNDVKQYDNIDYVRSPEAGDTYYCVGFNAPIVKEDVGGGDGSPAPQGSNPFVPQSFIVPPGGGGGGGPSGLVLGVSTSTEPQEEPRGEVLGDSVTCGAYLTEYLRFGKTNNSDEVTKLQVFLNENLGISLLTTGFFGPQTDSAVRDFQLKYYDTVLKPWVDLGLLTPNTATGYVYKTTLWQINELSCSALGLPTPQLP